MTHVAHLWLFFVLVFGIVILPGMDMAYVMGSALVGGTRSGLSAVAGIVAGAICHVTMAVLGISVLLKLVPGAFNVMLLAGALYIAWIGFSVLRSDSVFKTDTRNGLRSNGQTFRRGIVNIMLNPKAYLFTLAILPQFVRPEYGSLWLQGVTLWIIIALTQAGVYGSVAVAAGSLRQWLAVNPAAGIAINRVVGGTLILVAIFTGYHGWQMH
ncbi:MAG TPA: LysE family translocator [Gammaproteobacteria bacterium]|nr:LysE family translocator [Gammaproteobacteria bacterium]